MSIPMKKAILTLLLVCLMIRPVYAVSIVDTVLCKKVVLCANHMTVLVNRLTGEVKYVSDSHRGWVVLAGTQKAQCQSMYNAQVYLKLNCH